MHPHAILVRSHDMHAMEIPAGVRAIGRAGAGTNNIPVEEMSKRGVPVFNAPGANANAVKELVIAGHADRGAQSRSRDPVRRRTVRATTRRSTSRSRTARSSLPASSCRGTRSASSVWARSAAWLPTRRSSSA